MKLAVTGGTGFLGSRLTEQLIRQGHEVRVISRSQGYDITQPEVLSRPLKDAETVFHLAALVQSRPGPFENVNVRGFEHVLRACVRNRVRRLVYVSSFTVFGPSGDDLHTEASIPQRHKFFHGYDRTKYEGLGIARKGRSEMPIDIVFPTVVYGPGPLTQGNLIVRLFTRWIKSHMATLPGRGKPRWNFVYIDDVVDGLIRIAEARPNKDMILGGTNASLRELAETLVRTSGRHVVRLALPDWLFRLGCHAEDWSSRLLGFEPLVLPETGAFLLNHWQFSSAAAQAELGYAPRSLEEGVSSTFKWMRENRIV